MKNALSLGRELAVSQRRREQYQENVNDFVERDFIVSGEIPIKGAGEVIFNVRFPVSFVEKPLMFFGGDIEEGLGSDLVAGAFPTVSGLVSKWDTAKQPMGTLLYNGASIVVVSTGNPQMTLNFHWHFKGSALVNPVNSLGKVGGFI